MIGFLKSARGASTVEFAIVAPMLVFGVLSTADLGFEISDRMEIDQALRNGAEAAVEDPGVTGLGAVLEAIQPSADGDAIAWDVARICVCPESNAVSVDCFETCADDEPTAIYYNITGSREAVRFFLPQVTVSRSLSVQVR